MTLITPKLMRPSNKYSGITVFVLCGLHNKLNFLQRANEKYQKKKLKMKNYSSEKKPCTMKIYKKNTQQQQNKTRWKNYSWQKEKFRKPIRFFFYTMWDWYRKVLPQACTHDDYVHWRVSAVNKQNQDAES